MKPSSALVHDNSNTCAIVTTANKDDSFYWVVAFNDTGWRGLGGCF